MISITNTKVAGFAPVWAPFRGFSILFDTPGDALRRTGRYNLLACDVAGDPALGFYRALRDTLAALDVRLLTNTYLFCPLPPESYHVTVWDGANDGMLQQVEPQRRPAIEELLADVPAALHAPHPLIRIVRESPLVARRDWDLTFRFSHLTLVASGVLVAELAPVDADAASRLQQLVDARLALSEQVHAAYGFGPRPGYWPHVSLGYFANREHTQLARGCLATWNDRFATHMDGRSFTFAHADVYGFDDMATFYTA
jgi:hypothetical protein